MKPLVVIDADVLGRQRTGDETYVQNLLRRLPAHGAAEFRFAAITRRPDLVPAEIEPLAVQATSQVARMAWAVPSLLRRLRPALVHFQHALPLACPAPAVVTVHDLSFEGDRNAMGFVDRRIFKVVVPHAVRRARRVIAVSERTKRDLVGYYGIEPGRIAVTPHGVDPAFAPAAGSFAGKAGEARPEDRGTSGAPRPDGADPTKGVGDYLLYVGAIQARKNPLAAAEAAAAVGLPLLVAGPEREPALARELEQRGAELRGYVDKAELARLYRGAACLVLPSRYEGFGLPVLEAMACGTPVVVAADPALREVAGDAAVYAQGDAFADAVRTALADRDRLIAAGFERARLFSWDETARGTLAVYREALAQGTAPQP